MRNHDVLIEAYFDANFCVWGEWNGDDDGKST
jgi:hypothetical protein